MALAEADKLAPKDDADYKTKSDALNARALAILSAGETDCDKVAKQLEDFNASTKLQQQQLNKYEKDHPSVRESDKDLEARQKELETKGAKTLTACKDHNGVAAALAAPSVGQD